MPVHHTALQGVFVALLLKMNSGKQADMLRIASQSKLQKAPVKFGRFLALACVRVIQSFFLKCGSRLPEHISNLQTICPESLRNARGGLSGMTENVFRPQV